VLIEGVIFGGQNPLKVKPGVSGPRSEIGVGLVQRAVIMRTHSLTGVTSEYPSAHGGPQRLGDGASVFDVEVGDAAVRIDHTGLQECLGRTAIDALAAAATVALETAG
jgi:hypothetical protein